MFKFILLFVATTIWDFLNPFLAVAAPFITQFIKKFLKLQGNGAVIATAVIAVGLAILGALGTGMFAAGAGTVATIATAIFTASTLIYKFIIANEKVQASLPEALKN